MNRAIPAACVDLVLEFEGFKPVAYLCPAGVWTIGYGRTEGVKPGDRTTAAEERHYTISELTRIGAEVLKAVSVPLSDGEFGALVSFVYNVGMGRPAGRDVPAAGFLGSTLRRRLNAGDRLGAAAQFDVWTRGGGKVLPGLVRRRAAEKAMFLSSTSDKTSP